MPRLEQILQLLENDPADTFLRYALAMEYRSLGQSDSAMEQFRQLLNLQPPHVPSFFMLGQLLTELGEIESAREVLRQGIEVARIQGDQHAAGEMSQFLADLGSLGE